MRTGYILTSLYTIDGKQNLSGFMQHISRDLKPRYRFDVVVQLVPGAFPTVPSVASVLHLLMAQISSGSPWICLLLCSWVTYLILLVLGWVALNSWEPTCGAVAPAQLCMENARQKGINIHIGCLARMIHR